MHPVPEFKTKFLCSSLIAGLVDILGCGVFADHNSETIERFRFIFRVFCVFRGFLFLG